MQDFPLSSVEELNILKYTTALFWKHRAIALDRVATAYSYLMLLAQFPIRPSAVLTCLYWWQLFQAPVSRSNTAIAYRNEQLGGACYKELATGFKMWVFVAPIFIAAQGEL